MRKTIIVLVLTVLVISVFAPAEQAAAVQYYRRLLPNKSVTCFTIAGGQTRISFSNQHMAYSNPTQNAQSRYIVLLNGAAIYTSALYAMENGVGTAYYDLFGYDTVVSSYPAVIAMRFETYVQGIRVYESTMRGTCIGPDAEYPATVTNAVFGETTYRRWLENKTATCAPNGSGVRATVSNGLLEYNNYSGQDRNALLTLDAGAQVSLSGSTLTEPATGIVNSGTVDYGPFDLVSFNGFPFAMSQSIDSYAPDGLWRFRSTITVTCAAPGPAVVTIEDVPADGQVTVMSGTLDLEGRPTGPSGARSVPVTVEARGTGYSNGVITSRSLTSSISGGFNFIGLAPATYRFYVRTPTTLSVFESVVVPLAGSAETFGPMREGDADSNNAVTVADFSILSAAFGRSVGQVGYNINADFNKDGLVTIADFSLLANNFGQAGSIP